MSSIPEIRAPTIEITKQIKENSATLRKTICFIIPLPCVLVVDVDSTNLIPLRLLIAGLTAESIN